MIGLFADVHGNCDDLERVLGVLQRRGATEFYQLGDLGVEPLGMLAGMPCQHVFGNWEVSGLPHLPPDLHPQVAAWPARLTGPGWIASHATPAFPAACATTAATHAYMAQRRPRWQVLFPSLLYDDLALWAALAEMEAQQWRAAFHGHTHVQAVQRLEPDGRLVRVHGDVFDLPAGARTVIGIGSAGAPRDGAAPKCALFDPARMQVELIAV